MWTVVKRASLLFLSAVLTLSCSLLLVLWAVVWVELLCIFLLVVKSATRVVLVVLFSSSRAAVVWMCRTCRGCLWGWLDWFINCVVVPRADSVKTTCTSLEHCRFNTWRKIWIDRDCSWNQTLHPARFSSHHLFAGAGMQRSTVWFVSHNQIKMCLHTFPWGTAEEEGGRPIKRWHSKRMGE